MELKFKTNEEPVKVKVGGEGGRRIGFICATFRKKGDPDLHGDRFENGAFDEWLKKDLPRNLVKMFLGHYEPIGVPEIVESRDDGLYMEGDLVDTEAAKTAMVWAESGIAAHGSVGYKELEAAQETENGTRVNVIKEARCREGSLVIFPADEDASSVDIKFMAGLRKSGPWGKRLSAIGCLAALESIKAQALEGMFNDASPEVLALCKAELSKIESAMIKGDPQSYDATEITQELRNWRELLK